MSKAAIIATVILATGTAYAKKQEQFYYEVDLNRDCEQRRVMENEINEALFSQRPKTMVDALKIANKELGKSGCRVRAIEEKAARKNEISIH